MGTVWLIRIAPVSAAQRGSFAANGAATIHCAGATACASAGMVTTPKWSALRRAGTSPCWSAVKFQCGWRCWRRNGTSLRWARSTSNALERAA